ncbi:MAG: hypothetical protein HOO06_08610 [Bdellovibrionaceae bacterium]|jgi:glycerophosphoryl diester phosphodiesterase|nr:hypothetical protein [Pseudobdellovibrionaceae bacterium]
MSIIQDTLESIIDLSFSLIPQTKKFDNNRLIQLVAHRGYHQNNIKENTKEAFDICLKNGIWGIELDIQWTKNLVPVIHHDLNCGRVFNRPEVIISQFNFNELRKEIPEILTLDELIELYGKKIHLMIEVKDEHFLNPGSNRSNTEKAKIISHSLSRLEIIEDYHLISLNSDIFQYFQNLNSSGFLSISLLNAKEIFQKTIKSSLGGFTGHYLLINKDMRSKLKSNNKKVGVGFIKSKNSLIREINEGCDWVFTNHPLRLKKIIDQF